MTTPVELINLALKQAGVLGVGQTAMAEDIQDAFKLMNMMLAQWQVQRYHVYQLVNYGIACTGQASYTIGLGGDINQARPSRISSAFVRQFGNNPVDYPLVILKSREDYDRISVKSQQAMPSFLFYDSGYPLGTLYPWSIPTSLYELHVTVYAQLQQFATVADVITMPPEYERAIMYNLAGELRPMYGLQPDQTVSRLAMASLNILKNTNAQIPTMTLDGALLGKGNGYNPYSDISN